MKSLHLQRGTQLVDGNYQIVTEVHSGWSKGWVARVTLSAPGEKYDLTREWCRPDTTSLSRAGNGEKCYRGLTDGFYEADSVYRSYKSHRVYCEIRDGEVVRYTDSKAEAKTWMAE